MKNKNKNCNLRQKINIFITKNSLNKMKLKQLSDPISIKDIYIIKKISIIIRIIYYSII